MHECDLRRKERVAANECLGAVDGVDEPEKLLAVTDALVERGTLLKITSYLRGTAVHLRPKDSGDPGDLRLEVGDPADAFYRLVESAGLDPFDAVDASHLGRTAFDGPGAALEDEAWTYLPALNLAALLVDDRVAALAVTPARLD